LSAGPRLNRFLALAGIASRRHAGRLIADGRVTVNGSICCDPAAPVAPTDHVKVDGRRVSAQRLLTIVLNKPREFVCTKSDELGRATIYSLLPGALRHLNHVGRLDRDSEGLLILTNDGTLARRLTHPSQAIEKEYLVTLNQAVDERVLTSLTAGVRTTEGPLQAKAACRISPRRAAVTLDHGVKRQLRVMFASLGFRVTRLVRVRIGCFGDDQLPPGRWRHLSPAEIAALLTNPQNLRTKSQRRS
jgi:23S rRNA pseudouridine2605 synthase